MDKATIISDLSKSDKIRKAAYRIAGSNIIYKDLYQHLFLVLCELPEAKILDAYEKKYIDFLCIKIMQNNYHSLSSNFAVEYKIHTVTDDLRDDMATYNIEHEAEQMEAMIADNERFCKVHEYLNQPITQHNFFRITLLRMWNDGLSYRKISAKTKIPMKSVALAIQTAIKELKDQC